MSRSPTMYVVSYPGAGVHDDETPGARSPTFPGGQAVDRFFEWSERGRFEARQLDEAFWVARTNRRALLAFLDECYGRDGLSWPVGRVRGLRRWIRECDPLADYLVRVEFQNGVKRG